MGLTDTNYYRKDLLYSPGNYIQYLVITYNGKQSEIYMYITESFCCAPDLHVVNQLCFSF